MSQEQLKVEDYKVEFDKNSLAEEYNQVFKQKPIVQVPEPPKQVQVPQSSSQKRIVRLKKIVGCGCGDSFLDFQREVDASDPLQHGDVVENFKKGDRLTR